MLEERDASTGDLLVRYTYGDDLISQTRPDSLDPVNNPPITRYFHYDGQMSTRQLTDDATGAAVAITDQYAYDAFGVDVRQEGGGDNRCRYTGEQYDDSIGNYYLRARYYRPEAGRFGSRDPLTLSTGDVHTLHPYSYAQNDPIRNTDPSGLCSPQIFGQLAHQIIGGIYTKDHPGDVVDINRTINPAISLLRPDILNWTQSEIGEIKPFNPRGAIGGFMQLNAYLALANAITGGNWKPTAWQPGVQMFTVPGCIRHIGFTIFNAGGIIFYVRVENPYKTIEKAIKNVKELVRRVEDALNRAGKALRDAQPGPELSYIASMIQAAVSAINIGFLAQFQSANTVAALGALTISVVAAVALRSMLATRYAFVA